LKIFGEKSDLLRQTDAWMKKYPKEFDISIIINNRGEDFEQRLPNANKFYIRHVITLKENGLEDEAIELFNATVKYAKNFEVLTIRNLVEFGMKDEGIELLKRTVKYAKDSHKVFDSYILKSINLKDEAAFLENSRKS
jgi:DNA replication protein DnaD